MVFFRSFFLLTAVFLYTNSNAQGIQIEVPKGTTSAKFGYLEYLPENYQSVAGSTIPTIIFLHGVGEKGNGTTDLTKIDDFGIPKEIRKGNWPILNSNGDPPNEDFIVISPQSSTGFPTPLQIYDFIEYVKSTYKADSKRIYLTGLSAGGITTWRYLSTYNDQIAAAIPIAGHAKGYLDQLCNAKDIPIWAFHGDSDNVVNVSGSINALNTIEACNPVGLCEHLLTIYNGVSHNSWGNTYDLDWIDNSRVDPNYDPFNMSIYDWLLQFSKDSPLIVNLGADQTITLPINSVTIGSSNTSEYPISSYTWTKQSGPAATLSNANTSSLSVSGMVAGTYVFRLIVTDNQGTTAYDEITVTVLPEVVNQAPTANAGADKTIALPTNLAVINGSGSDTDGTIASYSWVKVSGPTATLQNKTSASLTALSLTEGTYLFGLTVTDDDGATGYDEVKLTVEAANIAPSVNAGSDKTIQLPTNSIVLNGTASDGDGTVITYQWSRQSGPTAALQNATTANLTATNLLTGTYIFRLTVTDNDGATGYDEVRVIVDAANQSPVAQAGSDQNLKLPVNSVTLIGSGTDADGSVASYNWVKVSGSTATLSNATTSSLSVSNLIEGTYVFGLTVTDNDGATGYDEVKVVVDAANVVPIANAGADKVMYLPTTSATLSGSGSDADGNITAYLWEKKSGPSVNLTNSNSATVSLRNLVEGTYTFILTVTDNDGAKDTDEVSVFVLLANAPPTANAGADKSITLPTNQINLTGTGTDTDGSIASYDWTKVSGPTATLNNQNTSIVRLTNLVQGAYIFGLTVTDDDGATDYDEVFLNVYPEPVNISPTVTAGTDISITLPVNSVNLTSSANDPDGTVASYLWEKIQGPGATINSSNSANTQASGLVVGSYLFRITVTDNDGASNFDEVRVTVNAQAVNPSPVVSAGSDITIRLPQNSTTFNGTASDDDPIEYLWVQVSGPNTASISNATILNPNISSLVLGAYVFRLTVTDNEGASSSDQISVNVTQANQNPIVSAGSDKIIQLPSNSVSITAVASDSDGSVSSYAWTRISGPNSETISNNTQATVNITGLSEGVYVFQVLVTDNEGGTSTDQVKVTVQGVNIIPIANAGSDSQIRLPINSANLSGAGSDPDGNIASYEWSKESGPMADMINQNTSTLTLNNLFEGVYVFRLTVTDNDGASNYDDVKLTVLPEIVNVAPIANAGSDRQITLPTNNISLSGSGTDSDGTITEYAWVKLSGPSATLSNASTSTVTINQMVSGTYIFRLKVTDDDGDSDFDDVQVIVNSADINQNPIADAGLDKEINLPTNSLNITGAGSDPDGSIVSYSWIKVTGPAVTMANTNNSVLVLSELVEGQYSFRFTIVDDKGASASDVMILTVHGEDVNQAPVANAGPNRSISLPTNTVILDGSGSDSDGSISSYTWQKVSGPTVTLDNINSATLTASSLTSGTYIFRLTVVDDDGDNDSDEVRVIVVNEDVNINPVVDAGADIIIQLPTNSANLVADASDEDGIIVSYVWEQVNGLPTNMSDLNSPVLTLTDLTVGEYEYRIIVTDDNGYTDFDKIKVTVQTEDINLSPVADAGDDVLLSLPTNSISIAGKGSDNDGSIISYNWIKISGSSVTIQNAELSTISLFDMVEGEYTFRLTVTDNDGGTGQDEVIVYVTSEEVNKAPTANTGEDVNLYLPDNSVNIYGSGSDVDGEIASFDWVQTSGTDASMIGIDNSKLELYNLEEGMYKFKLTVTDNEGATGTDYINVIVSAEGSNLTPEVNFGANRVENLPLDSLVITGNTSDPDGIITDYSWILLSGPSSTMIENQDTLVVKDLVSGTYIFRLTVTDNAGETASDNIIITINPVGTNRNPIADAGGNKYITLPQDTVTLEGIASDPDGDVFTVQWNQLSGPIVTFSALDQQDLFVSDMKEGNYVFEFTVTDDNGASATDLVSIIVNPVPPDNIPPVADAGEDFTILNPEEPFVHVGTGTDEDGLVISYNWKLIEGPEIQNFTINSDTLALENLAAGDYIFELSVMDNDSSVAYDEVRIQVLPGDLTDIGAHKIFSPDGNGIDDYWEIDNLDMVSGCQLKIFNRFGLTVYESNNYQNDWDGTYNGKPLPEADYYYVIKCGEGQSSTSGGIRIIRDY